MARISKSLADLVALFLGGTFLFWLVGHLLQPLPILTVQPGLMALTSQNISYSAKL